MIKNLNLKKYQFNVADFPTELVGHSIDPFNEEHQNAIFQSQAFADYICTTSSLAASEAADVISNLRREKERHGIIKKENHTLHIFRQSAQSGHISRSKLPKEIKRRIPELSSGESTRPYILIAFLEDSRLQISRTCLDEHNAEEAPRLEPRPI